MRIKTILIFSLLTITSALLHAQKIVYNKNGLSLQIRSTLTKSYRYKNFKGQDEDRYIWQVDARLANANAVPVYLHGFYIKRTVKCFEGNDDPHRSNCRKGTVLENMPVVLPSRDSKLISGCFDTNCPENLDIDWWISDWVLKSGTVSKNIPAQNGLSTFESANSTGFDPATWAEMNEVKKLYEKVVAETPKYAYPSSDDRFLISKARGWENLSPHARSAESYRRWALVNRKQGNLPCVKYFILKMKKSLVEYKAYFEFLESLNWESPSTLNNSHAFVQEHMNKYSSRLLDEAEPIAAEAKKILEKVEGCPTSSLNILEEWNEADYATIGQPNAWIDTSVEPATTASPSSPDVAGAKAQQVDNTSETTYNAKNSAGKDTPSQQSNTKLNKNVKAGDIATEIIEERNAKAASTNSQHQPADNEAQITYKTNFTASRTASSKGDHSKALEYMNEAITAQPAAWEAFYYRAIIYNDLGQYYRALSDLNDSESLGNHTYSLYFTRSGVHRVLKRMDEALADLTTAISIVPQEKKAMYYRFRALFFKEFGQLQNALDDYNQALRLEPNNSSAIKEVELLKKQLNK